MEKFGLDCTTDLTCFMPFQNVYMCFGSLFVLKSSSHLMQIFGRLNKFSRRVFLYLAPSMLSLMATSFSSPPQKQPQCLMLPSLPFLMTLSIRKHCCLNIFVGSGTTFLINNSDFRISVYLAFYWPGISLWFESKVMVGAWVIMTMFVVLQEDSKICQSFYNHFQLFSYSISKFLGLH